MYFTMQASKVSNFHQEAQDIRSQGVTLTPRVCVCLSGGSQWHESEPYS